MRALLAGFRGCYGSNPLHLLTMLAGFALLGYVIVTAGPSVLWRPEGAWWKSIAVWFVGAIVAHDFVLFPIYSLADRLLGIPVKRQRRGAPHVPVRTYLRVPALGSALILLLFFPDIVEQGAPLYLADTGLTQQPFFGRWLLLSATMFATSAVIYGARLVMARVCKDRIDEASGTTATDSTKT
ncbi:hypothetical protein [Mycobacterium kyorinense]|uniref:Uncharacterized protein n=1 Tax=Mycobacterium kyorinense TaxID=487514 RepID=A0A1X1XPZ2_9MYCO|nr:hypothetical protein [Mycobacterium kyorinense]ORW00917.1 hypothetical protein AWC14_09195 [Mycobacterium kyorinense]